MISRPSVVTPQVVRKVAELSRLKVPDGDLSRWSQQLARIVSYIDQLEGVREEASGTQGIGPATPLREDEPRDGAGEAALEKNAPRRLHGYGVVPRVVGSGS